MAKEYPLEAEDYIFKKHGWEMVIRCRVVWAFKRVLDDLEIEQDLSRYLIEKANEIHDKQFPVQKEKIGELS